MLSGVLVDHITLDGFSAFYYTGENSHSLWFFGMMYALILFIVLPLDCRSGQITTREAPRAKK